jgi:hypothetical protein
MTGVAVLTVTQVTAPHNGSLVFWQFYGLLIAMIEMVSWPAGGNSSIAVD